MSWGGQIDNWTGPTVGAIEAWIRSAGFARAEILGANENANTVCIAAHRLWVEDDQAKECKRPPIQLLGVTSHISGGRTFQSQKEHYLSLWFQWDNAELSLTHVFPCVHGCGIAPVSCSAKGDGSAVVTFRLPPGLAAGAHQATLQVWGWSRSEPVTFYLDLTPLDPGTGSSLVLGGIQDGVSWDMDVVKYSSGGWMTLWVEGLSPEADIDNTRVVIAGIPHHPSAISWNDRNNCWQLNLKLRPVVGVGQQSVVVEHRVLTSNLRSLEVRGPRLQVIPAEQVLPPSD